jgi:RNA polymerase sigma-70 factor (ECF subfamily)
MDEHAAIALLKQGDIRGLEHLVRAYQVRAVRAAYLITHDRPMSEDIVQSAFLRAYERIGQFDDTRPFGPWFLRSVAHDAAKVAAQRRRHVSLDDERRDAAHPHRLTEPIDPDPDPEALLLSAESRQEVWAALDRLPAQQRAALVLRYHLDLPEAEVAGHLGVPAGTAKSRLHHARKRLHALLRPAEAGYGVDHANSAEGRTHR